MGYSLQPDVALRNRTPASSFRTPKTLTPGSRLQQRGRRYYTPHLGRFLARDPLAEKGGPNLHEFAGNQPISMFDAFGLAAAGLPPPRGSEEYWKWYLNKAKECKFVRDYGQIYDCRLRWLLRNIKQKGCDLPSMTCPCCSPPARTEYDPGANAITICANYSSSYESFEDTFVHELTHAYQYCKRKGPVTWEQWLCDEIQARATDGYDGTPKDQWKELMQNDLWNVMKNENPNLTWQEFLKMFEDNYDSCALSVIAPDECKPIFVH